MSERQPGIRIGQLLRQRRLELGLTLQQLGEKSGIHYSCIARVEKGERRATADFLIKVAQPLGYSRYELLVIAGFLSDEEVDRLF